MRNSLVVLLALLTCEICPAQTTNPAASPQDPGAALRYACWAGDLKKATQLLNAGAPLEGKDNKGQTPLILACRNHPDVVKMLLAHGANINVVEDDGDPAISIACEEGDLASAQLLMAAGSPLNPVNKYGRTPLMQAAREGHDNIVSWLIGQHVDVNYYGLSDPAIYYAIWRDHVTTAKLLLDSGADLHLANDTVTDPNHGFFLKMAWAVATNDPAIVDLLLSHGMDINFADPDGTTALIRAVQSAKPPMIVHLLEKGADPNLADNQGRTPLMLSVNYQQGGAREGIQPLLEHGAKLEARDKLGRTALIWAGMNVYEPVVSFLVDSGADINAADNNNETALTYAGDRGNDEIVALLKSKGAKRTDVHIIARPQPTPPESYGHQWALAAGAIYSQRNGQNPFTLGLHELGTIAELKRELKADWGITDRTSFLKGIDYLRTKGDRMAAESAGTKVAALSDIDFAQLLVTKTPAQKLELKVLREKYSKWKDKCCLAWDLCRRANLINLGCAASYITKDEAWPLLMENAKQIQGSFTSWQEMSDNFLDGRQMWAEWDDPSFEACAKLLLDMQDPNSPWTQLPWNTELTTN